MILDGSSVHLPLPEEYIVDDYIPRTLQDKGSNANRTMSLDFCKRIGLRILNGRIGSDKGVGTFTCHTHRGQSVVDYVLAITDILQLFCYLDIGDPNILSDQSIVHFALLSTHFFRIK